MNEEDISQILVDFGVYNQMGINAEKLDMRLRDYVSQLVSGGTFTREELETLYTLTSDAYIDSPDLRSSIMSKLSKLLKEKGDE